MTETQIACALFASPALIMSVLFATVEAIRLYRLNHRKG